MSATHGGKGSGRRKEDKKKLEENLSQIVWGIRDKSNDDFKVNVKGKANDNKS
jgi:hypothetical protein